MAGGPQKPDHGGNFYMMPRRVQDSVAWRSLSIRARVVLDVFLARHTGFNNGKLAVGIKEIGRAIGDQNHRGNGKAVAELIEHGFLECMTGADHVQRKTREYRITFIPTGEGKRLAPATNEYADWRPAASGKRKFGGARTLSGGKSGGAVAATQAPDSVVEAATERKLPVAVTAAHGSEIAELTGKPRVAVTAPLLVNQSTDVACRSAGPEIVAGIAGQSRRGSIGVDTICVGLDELRPWTRAAIDRLGYGGARKLAADCGVPEPVLSRFRQGKSLPDRHRLALQEACGRALPYIQWRAQDKTP